MSALTRRLTRLEATRPNREPDAYERHSYDLCQGSALLGAIWQAAQQRARRRALAEDRWPGSRMFDLPDIRELAHIEQTEISRFWDASGHDLWTAIRSWIEEPDALGWPPSTWGRGDGDGRTDYEIFLSCMRTLRQTTDRNRAGRAGDRWRQDNPGWRAGMPEDEYLAWDIERLDRAAAAGLW